MEIDIIHTLIDNRMGCISVLIATNTKSYIDFIEEIFAEKGGIKGQRTPLQSKSAIEIRKRLIKDIEKGAVIPPMVLGLLAAPEHFNEILDDQSSLIKMLKFGSKEYDNISLIDGMQRTAALKKALEKNPDLKTEIRIEVWVAQNINNLIYRMLVLNTAQIPWSVKRQLEVVFDSLSKSISEQIPDITLFKEDDKSRRSKAGQYQASHIIELFVGFSLRKIKLEIKDAITEEFSRLDVIDSTSSSEFSDAFIAALNYLFKIDKIFDRGTTTNEAIQLKRFKKGYDIFSSQPARMGFVTAISQKIYGRPGLKYEKDKISTNKENLFSSLDEFIGKIDEMSNENLYNFLDLPGLDERINIPTGKVGEFQRSYFLKVFYEFFELIQSGEELSDLAPVWQAYH